MSENDCGNWSSSNRPSLDWYRLPYRRGELSVKTNGKVEELLRQTARRSGIIVQSSHPVSSPRFTSGYTWWHRVDKHSSTGPSTRSNTKLWRLLVCARLCTYFYTAFYSTFSTNISTYGTHIKHLWQRSCNAYLTFVFMNIRNQRPHIAVELQISLYQCFYKTDF